MCFRTVLTIGLICLASLFAIQGFSQPPTLPFHWAWRDYPFADSLCHLQEIEVMKVNDGRKSKVTMASYQWVRFDSLGRAVDEIYMDPGDAVSGRAHRLHWKYDSLGCPERYILIGGALQSHPSSRYTCKNGLLVNERCERNRAFAIKHYVYDFFQSRPDYVVVYKGSSNWPREVVDTLHYNYDSLRRLVGYSSKVETLKVIHLDERVQSTMDVRKGPLTTISYWPVEDGIPDRLFVERRGYRNNRLEARSVIYLTVLHR